MDEKRKVRGNFRIYLQWPLFLSVLMVLLTAAVGAVSLRAGIIVSFFTLIYIGIALWLYFSRRKGILGGLIAFSQAYDQSKSKFLEEMLVPYCVADITGRILWMNQEMGAILGDDKAAIRNITQMFPDITKEMLATGGETVSIHSAFKDKKYRVDMKEIHTEEAQAAAADCGLDEGNSLVTAIYLIDETQMLLYKQQINDQKLVAGLIYLDNYDEALESVEEVRRSLLTALIDRKISKYISSMNGIVKSIEKDKYFFVIKQQYVAKMQDERFSILEDVKTVNIGNQIPLTLSIGLGLSAGNYSQSYNYARVAIDLALARGGDQAVIKDCHGITYYGGKREMTAKNTRVKARVKAEALREYITVNDKIFVMGHTLTDVDSFGAAIGICRAANALGKKANVVINEVSASLRPLYNMYIGNPSYPDDLFLTSEQALNLADENSMVVVVDTNRPKMVECEELLYLAKTIVVLDHHRQSSDSIDNALLSYIEPYASSACEMVSEILQYIVDDIQIPNLEASSMYAGIMIDTNSFMNRTGVRTFEAAAFLRRSGADITLVRKMFRDDMEGYRAKAAIISNAEVYQKKFAIATGTDLQVESPTIIGAQAANELLDISEIKASFVLTEYNGKIYVSARSIDEVNVQVIMEKLGGGGHMNASGAQFNHTDMDEAVACLKQVLDNMIKEGDI